ncbi:hypothetical protein V2G26_020889 [Clonostachys chloroleuca]
MRRWASAPTATRSSAKSQAEQVQSPGADPQHTKSALSALRSSKTLQASALPLLDFPPHALPSPRRAHPHRRSQHPIQLEGLSASLLPFNRQA